MVKKGTVLTTFLWEKGAYLTTFEQQKKVLDLTTIPEKLSLTNHYILQARIKGGTQPGGWKIDSDLQPENLI